MTRTQQRQVERIAEILKAFAFPDKFAGERTAICLMALMDRQPIRPGLVTGSNVLHDGARITDILEFSRRDLNRPVAENSREDYRKRSLKPLVVAGMVSAHARSTNDPQTYYTIDPQFEDLVLKVLDRRKALAWAAAEWQRTHPQPAVEHYGPASLEVPVQGTVVVLSPGRHNELIAQVVTKLAPAYAPGSSVVYLGDAHTKMLFLDAQLAARLNIILDKHEKLPDVILYREETNVLYVVEAASSTGVMSDARVAEMRQILEKQGNITYGLVLGTALHDRKSLRRFAEDIGWGTFVWIAEEGFGIIHFDRIAAGRRQ